MKSVSEQAQQLVVFMRRQGWCLGGIFLATVGLAAWAWAVRVLYGIQVPLVAEIRQIRLSAAAVGVALEQVIIPIVLFYGFCRTGFFHRLISEELAPAEKYRLVLVLVLGQCLTLGTALGVEVWVRQPLVSFGFLIVLIGGFLGGWSVGLWLGGVTCAVRVGVHWYLFPETGVMAHTLGNLWGLAAIWAGLVAGLTARLLGIWRFEAGVAFFFGLVMDGVGGLAMAIAAPQPNLFTHNLMANMLVSGLALAMVSLLVRSVEAEVSQRKAEAAELSRTQSELRALRAQINPHFFFNALNTIRYFVRIDPEAARALLLSLSEVFQRALRAGDFVPLRSEISYVEAYLSIEKARLDKRLHIIWSLLGTEGKIQDTPLLDNTVPTLILQPIVENAIIHGIAKKAEGGTLRIAIDQADGNLLLQVADDGIGIEPNRLEEILHSGQGKGTSIGLKNVDRRLRVMYGEHYKLVIKSQPGHGTWVQIKIPLEIRQPGKLEFRGRFDSLPKYRVDHSVK
ncbi:MAG: histidine kinase [Blastocatellia bacterium]|nr:histidine kinase [Blastocatellia bacterium]